jgi:hypothetical protein
VFDYMGLDHDPWRLAERFSAFLEDALTRYERPRGFACCFCGEGIALGGFDPCVLTLGTYHQGPPDKRVDQEFYCHADYFSAATHPGIRPYVLAGVRSE